MTLELSHFKRAIDGLRTAPRPQELAPPRKLLAVDLALSWQPRVLVIGAGLPPEDLALLLEHGCEVESVLSLPRGMQLMYERSFDLVAVSPFIDEEGDGVFFIRSLKLASDDQPEASTRFVIHRYRTTPCVILPFVGTTEYALYVDSSRWYLADAAELPIWKTIVSLGDPDDRPAG